MSSINQLSSQQRSVYQITWKIKDFRKRLRDYETSTSPVFPRHVTSPTEYQFHLELFPEETDAFIHLCMLQGKAAQPLEYQIALLDVYNQKRFVMGGIGKFNEEGSTDGQMNMVRVAYLKNRDNLLADKHGALTIHCEVSVYRGGSIPRDLGSQMTQMTQQMTQPQQAKSYAIDSASSREAPASKIAEDLQLLLTSGRYSDLIMVFGDGSGDGQKEFAVHKAILAARSAVLDAKLRAEQLGGRIVIPDLSEDAGQQLLAFLYTEKEPNLEKHALELLVAADKFKLASLKALCEAYLSRQLAIDSVASLLVLASAHQAEQLKEKCIDYITDHSSQVMATEGWKEVVGQPPLLCTLFKFATSRKRKK